MKKLLLVALSFAALANVGCKKHTQPLVVDDELQIVISSSIKGTSVVAAGRAEASKENFVAGDTVGVFVVPYQNATTAGTLIGSGDYADNIAFIAQTDPSTFKPSVNDKISFPNSTTKVDVYAFGMYHTKHNDLGANPKTTKVVLDKDQTSALLILKNDLMTAQKLGVAPTDGNVPLEFHHRLAKVNINFTTPATYKSDVVKGVKSVYIVNTKLESQVNLTDTAVKPLLLVSDTVSINAFQASKTASAYQYEAIVMPQTVATGSIVARVVLLVGDSNKEVSFNCISTSPIEYKTGSKSKLSLTFEGESVLSISGVTIVPWGDAADNSAIAKLAIKQLFKVTGNTTKINSVTSVKLTVDNTLYAAPTVLRTDTVSCSYLPLDGHGSTEITKVEFLNAGGTRVALFEQASPGWPILGRPTDENYDTITATFNF